MEFYTISFKNKLFSFQDLTEENIQEYINQEIEKGLTKKYLFNVFYAISNPNNYLEKTLEEIFTYSLKNFTEFFKHLEEEYSKEDISNFALAFALDNYHFTSENILENVNFIKNTFVEYDSEKEIVQWCQEKIKLFMIYVYSYDIENYHNGTISNLINELKDVAKNHKEDLIYDIISKGE